MLSLGDIKLNTILDVGGEPFQVVASSHVHMGRGKAVLQTKLKNLITGKVMATTFKDGDRIELADLKKQQVQYLYFDDENVYFMDNQNFETLSLPIKNAKEEMPFFKEGILCHLMISNGNPVRVELPVKISYKIVSTPNGIKGDTATGGTKPATLESGAIVQVPLFIKENDSIVVNTTTGDYVERA